MDRRTFLTEVGSMGAAAAGGWMALESGSVRAADLAKAAGVSTGSNGSRRGPSGSAPVYEGLTLGYLPGSPALLEIAMRGRAFDSRATQTRWARWDPSLARVTSDPVASVSIGALQRAKVAAAPGMLRSLEVIAYFAVDEAPYVAPFNAWKYEAAGTKSKRETATSPLTFDALMHDRVSLKVNYGLSGSNLVPGTRSSGMLYLPLGALNGPGLGLYVLAGPSRYTGAQPDLSGYRFSGNLHAPLSRLVGGTPDFDFVTLTIRRSLA